MSEGGPVTQVYTQRRQGQDWLQRYQGRKPLLACVLGFTQTGLIPGISAAGATPHDRQFTAIADAEFLVNGVQPQPKYPLPPLQQGASPVLISRAIVESLDIPVHLFNAGLPQPPAVAAIDLGGAPARCLSQGRALDLPVVKHLLDQGLRWGEKLAAQVPSSYVILGECVVGGTTTALAVLTGLGFAAQGKVNSSHPACNHGQKWELVEAGLVQILQQQRNRGSGVKLGVKPLISGLEPRFLAPVETGAEFQLVQAEGYPLDPLELVAAVGDPMQVVVAGMAIAASRTVGVLLAGGTQMLAVYGLARAIAQTTSLDWRPDQVVVGTTRWVAEDATGDTVGLAELIGSVPLLATQLSFAESRFATLRAYEQGFVKEGVAAGGCAIAAHLYQNWQQPQLLRAIEGLADRLSKLSPSNL
jgi:NaMN:DMB phosphoribosyltransferase